MLGKELVTAVLADHRTAAIGEPLRAMLGFLQRMSLEPDRLTAADARAVLAAGVTRVAMDEAIHVAYLFNTIVRIADTMEFAIPTDGFAAGTKMLLKRGYK